MQIVESLKEAQAMDSVGRQSYVLHPHQRYVMLDHEAEAGVRDGVLEKVGDLDEVLPQYRGQPLEEHRIFIPFTGGQGDSLLMVSCIEALKRTFPKCRVTVSCPALHHELLELCAPDLFEIVGYPLAATELRHFSFFASLEYIRHVPKPYDFQDHTSGASFLDIFAECLSFPNIESPHRLAIPSELKQDWNIGPSQSIRIGVAFGKSGNVRTYPTESMLEIVHNLVDQHACAYLLGRSADVGSDLPHSPPWVVNLIDHIPIASGLAAVMSQLDGLICSDGFFMHLGGVLRIPTLAIFASTAGTIARGYDSVFPIFSSADCSPCGAAGSDCPIGHQSCIAHHQPNLIPPLLARRMLAILRSRRTQLQLTGDT